jgi:hypothetical protein
MGTSQDFLLPRAPQLYRYRYFTDWYPDYHRSTSSSLNSY